MQDLFLGVCTRPCETWILSEITFPQVNLCPTVLFEQIGFVYKDPAQRLNLTCLSCEQAKPIWRADVNMEAKEAARSISSLFITMTHIQVTQIGVENRSEKSLLLAEYLHVKSVLTDSFPQTDGTTYGRYWPSSHSRQGSCVYSCLIFAPSSRCSIVLVRRGSLRQVKLNVHAQYKQLRWRANFPFKSNDGTNITQGKTCQSVNP